MESAKIGMDSQMSAWVEKKKSWFQNPKAVVQTQEKKEIPTAVTFPRLKCPNCGSVDVPSYKRDKPIRYHKCEKCGWHFKSIEES